jgi:hypothetical protein
MMKVRKMLLIAAAAGAITFGSIILGLREQAGAGANACGAQTQTAAACARCGDGVCARSCENERTCPADCKAVVSETEKAVADKSVEQAGVVN